MGWRRLAESGVANAGLITFATEEGERGKKQQQKIRKRNKDHDQESEKGFRKKVQETGL